MVAQARPNTRTRQGAPMKDKNCRDPERYRLHAEVCRVLTDPKRLMLLDVLRVGEHSVGDLAEELGCNLANASQHLAVLRSAGLVDTRRAGTSVLYSLAEPELVDACDVIHRIVGRRLAGRSAGVTQPRLVTQAEPVAVA
jgi:ArsR family transcriptional regulator, virulence genes transcriptional regulator